MVNGNDSNTGSWLLVMMVLNHVSWYLHTYHVCFVIWSNPTPDDVEYHPNWIEPILNQGGSFETRLVVGGRNYVGCELCSVSSIYMCTYYELIRYWDIDQDCRFKRILLMVKCGGYGWLRNCGSGTSKGHQGNPSGTKPFCHLETLQETPPQRPKFNFENIWKHLESWSPKHFREIFWELGHHFEERSIGSIGYQPTWP